MPDWTYECEWSAYIWFGLCALCQGAVLYSLPLYYGASVTIGLG